MRSLSALGRAALWYAARGCPVFLLAPGTKVPHFGSHGLSDATTDPALIAEWWAEHPLSNVGLATGYAVDVVDVDGLTGVASWARLFGDHPTEWLAPDVPILGTVSTPRAGGSHLYVTAVASFGNRTVLGFGMDYRGKGGYVVAPPSAGPGGKRYRWRRPLELRPHG